MKKGFKVFLIIAGAFIIVLGLAIGALFTPLVQKHLVLSALGGESAHVDIQKVRLKMDRVLLNGLLIEHQNGTILTMDAARIEVPLTDLLLKKRVSFGRVDLEGLQLDLRKSNSDQAFRGLLSPISAIGPVSIDELSVEGQVLFSQNTSLKLSAGGAIKLGQEKPISIEGDFFLGDGSYPVGGILALSNNGQGVIEGLSLDLGVDVVEDEVVATVTANAELNGKTENYFLNVLLERDTDSLDLFRGEGSYDSVENRARFSFNGQLVREQLVSIAPKLEKRLPSGLHLDCQFQGGTYEDTWRVEVGNVDASVEGVQTSLKMLQPFTLDFKRGQFAGIKSGSRVASLKITVPFSRVFPSKIVSGPPLIGELFLESKEKGFIVRSEQIIRWSGLSVVDRHGDVTKFSVTANPTFERSGDLISLAIGEVKAFTQDSKLFDGHINLTSKGPELKWDLSGSGVMHLVDTEKLFPLPGDLVFRVGENLKFSFNGKMGSGAIVLEQGKCEIEAGLPWLLGDLIKPVTLRYDEDMGIRIDAKDEWMELETLKLDVDRFSSLVPRMSFDVEPLNSKWFISSSKDSSFVLQVREPLLLEKVTFAWDNKYYVHDELLSGNPILTFGRAFFGVEIENLLLGRPEVPFATGKYFHQWTKDKTDWGGSFLIDLPHASKSALFKGGQNSFESGVLLLEFRPGGPKGGAELAMDLSDAIINSMPDETFSGNFKLAWPSRASDGRLLDASVQLTGAKQNSNCKFTQWSESAKFDAQILHLVHVKFVKDAFFSQGKSSFDNNIGPFPNLELEVVIDKLHFSEAKPITDVKASVFLANEGIALRNATANLGERGIGKGYVTYYSKPVQGKPNLSGELRFSHVQLADLFKKPEFGHRAPIDGITSGVIAFDAIGNKASTLLEGARVQVEINSERGSFRFQKLEDKLAQITKLAKSGGQISKDAGKLGGALTQSLPILPDLFQEAGRLGAVGGEVIAGTSLWLSRIMKIPGMKDVLTRIEFDSANINAQRNSSGSVTLTRFDLRGSSLLVRATGKLGAIPVHRILDAPMALSLYIGVKGLLPQKFLSFGQLDSDNQVEGYTMFKTYPVGVGGTLRKPKLDLLWDILFPDLNNTSDNGNSSVTAPPITKPRLPGGFSLPF